jgi:tRNA(Ile)-lysidine synthase
MNDGSVLAAVSGGADSVAMLHILRGNGVPIAAGHYNHGLRETADADEAFVRSLCESLEIPFFSEKGDVAGEAVRRRAGVEETAREMRYAFLERVRKDNGYDVIATAHTADDNVETVLMNLVRGAGLSGSCGIPPLRGSISRPVLHMPRDDILRYLSERGIPFREDESNADTAYRRNYIRHEVVPLLKQINPSLTEAVTRLTVSLGEDEAHLTALAKAELVSPFPAARLSRLPKPIASRICRLMVSEYSDHPPERIHIDAMLDIAAGGNGRRRNITSGLTVVKKGGMILIEKTPDRRR